MYSRRLFKFYGETFENKILKTKPSATKQAT
jgi:hypothetical protein